MAPNQTSQGKTPYEKILEEFVRDLNKEITFYKSLFWCVLWLGIGIGIKGGYEYYKLYTEHTKLKQDLKGPTRLIRHSEMQSEKVISQRIR